MNRKILVGVLIALTISNVFGTLFAIGVLSLSANPSNSTNTMTLGATTGMAATVSTTITPGTVHHHYIEDLSVSLGGCATPSGTVC